MVRSLRSALASGNNPNPAPSSAAGAAHTPGPWSVRAVHDGLAAFGGDNGHGHPRTVFQCRAHGRADAECAANARLIAAAPDLAEALRDLLAVAEMTTFSDQYPAECEAARSALSKALGHESRDGESGEGGA